MTGMKGCKGSRPVCSCIKSRWIMLRRVAISSPWDRVRGQDAKVVCFILCGHSWFSVVLEPWRSYSV